MTTTQTLAEQVGAGLAEKYHATPGLRSLEFLGTKGLVGGYPELIAWLQAALRVHTGGPLLLIHANCHTLYCLSQDPDLFRDAQLCARLLLEGIALKSAARVAGLGSLPTANGTDLFPKLMDAECENGLRLFLLGGEPGVAEAARDAIQRRWPRVSVVGAVEGFFPPHRLPEIGTRIARTRPDILLLGLGSPLQERLALTWASRFDVRLVWSVGGLFDFLADRRRRAPPLLRRLGLEWLFRLTLEPRRLWRRTFVEVPWLARRMLVGRIADV